MLLMIIFFVLIVFTDVVFLCVMPVRESEKEDKKMTDSPPRFVRLNCDGALGAFSNGASSMKLVVQILSLAANVPTE